MMPLATPKRYRPTAAQPNDLLDERDRVLLQLSKLVSVNVIEQDGGVANVLIGNGQPLVIGGVAGENHNGDWRVRSAHSASNL